MSTGRFATPGKTRSCPHCRATILDSATVCPGCNHHLRFDPSGAGQRAQPAVTPLRVEGTLRHSSSGGAWEYSIVLAIRNDRGEEIARQVVGVGALQPSESRTFTLAVEVYKPAEVREPKPQAPEPASRGAPDPRASGPRAPGKPGVPPMSPGLQPPKPGLAGSGRPEPLRPPGLPGSKPASSAPAPARPATPPGQTGSAVGRPAPAPSPSPSPTSSPARPGGAPSQTPAAASPAKPAAPSLRPPFSRTPFFGKGK